MVPAPSSTQKTSKSSSSNQKTPKNSRVRNADSSAERERKKPKRDRDGPSTSRRDKSRDKSKDKPAARTKSKDSASASPSKPAQSKEVPKRSASSFKRDISKERNARMVKEIASSSTSRNTGLSGDYWSNTLNLKEPRGAKLNAEKKIANETSTDEDTMKNGVAPSSKSFVERSRKDKEINANKLATTPKKRNGESTTRNGETSKKSRDESKTPKKSTKANGEMSKKDVKATPAKANGVARKDAKADKKDLKATSRSRRSLNGTASTSKKGRKDESSSDDDSYEEVVVKKGRRKAVKRQATPEEDDIDEDGPDSVDDDEDEEDSEAEDSEEVADEEEGEEEDDEEMSSDIDEEEKERRRQNKRDLKLLRKKGHYYKGKRYVQKTVAEKEKERRKEEKEKKEEEEGVREEKKTRVQRIMDGFNEHEAIWDDRLDELSKKRKVDFIVGCTDPGALWNSGNWKCKVLVVYKGMPRGEWMDCNANGMCKMRKVLDFIEVQKQLDKVEEVLFEECKYRVNRFENAYPGRYLPGPATPLTYYGNTDIDIHRTLQMARQADINEQNEADGVPPLYIVDWCTSTKTINKDYARQFVKNSINAFTFSNYSKISRRVEKKLQSGNIERMDEHCKAECPCADPTNRGKCTCDPRKRHYRRHECGSSCRCDVNTCKNRIVQRGRQMPIIIMRHPSKGWTIRAYVDIKQETFVHEYVGELVTYHQNRSMDQTYALDQSDSLWDLSLPSNRKDQHKARMHNKGKPEGGYCHRALVVNGLRVANEARFSSHGCRPKLHTVVTYVDRQSYGLHRTAFYANRDLRPGEELTWNYHGEALDRALENKKPFLSSILPACDCGEFDCPISKNTQVYVHDQEPEDDCDSFLDSDEEKEREESETRKNDRKSRLEKRDQRKSSNAENESASSSSSATPPPAATTPAARPARGRRAVPISPRLSFSPQL